MKPANWGKLMVGVAGLMLFATSGCQTWVPEAGLTLPSGDYLKHQPQYIPPSPSFPLSRELESIEEANRNQQQVQGGGF